MAHRSDDEILIRRYLLGDVEEGERSLLEQRMLTDRQYFDQLLRVEEDLTDEYARGEMSKREREMFESHFMKAPERRESVAFALALGKYTGAQAAYGLNRQSLFRPRQAGWLRVLPTSKAMRIAIQATLALALLVLVDVTVWLMVERAQLKRQVEQALANSAQSAQREEELRRQLEDQHSRNQELALRLESEQSRLAQMEQDLARLQRQTTGARDRGGIVTLALVAGLSRTPDRASTLSLSPDADQVRLELEMSEVNHRDFRAEVQTPEGETVWSRSGLKARRVRGVSAVVIQYPASLMSRSDYWVALSGATADGSFEKIGTYPFRVVRK
jgi:hypothetical protein